MGSFWNITTETASRTKQGCIHEHVTPTKHRDGPITSTKVPFVLSHSQAARQLRLQLRATPAQQCNVNEKTGWKSLFWKVEESLHVGWEYLKHLVEGNIIWLFDGCDMGRVMRVSAWFTKLNCFLPFLILRKRFNSVFMIIPTKI